MNGREVEPIFDNHNNCDQNRNPITTSNNNTEVIKSYYKSEEKSFRRRIELVWSNLSYTITTSSGNPLTKCMKTRKGPQNRQLIKNLNGSVVSGKLTAIMGPSGAGKTTLIECLAARRRTGVSGKIMANYYGFVFQYSLQFYTFTQISILSLQK